MKNLIQPFYNWYRGTIRNPKYRWWLVLGTLAYLFSPIDIAPDFIPIVGWIDDAAITALLVSEVSQIFIDYVKLRQGQQPSEVADNAAEGNKSVDDTVVEVKAVSVE
ncbi:YkvA family protein [Aerosakkonemataceae cyanobacterium BLCC-F50]|uniref:YkvA family protein n=1 Tax=Floridaenema flaviceps BLCC-F50 TaxID=3153642 RepID=A0ABV4XM84_9CYAN